MGNTFYFAWEPVLMTGLQHFMNSFWISIASFCTFFGETYFAIAILGYIYYCSDKKLGKKMMLGVLLIVFNPLIKNIFLRRRPYFDHEAIKCLRPVSPDGDIYDIAVQGFSFPSSHSTISVIVFGNIFRETKKYYWLIFPLLVGMSRVVLGVHYPTDVLAGWLLGFIIVAVVPFIIEHLPSKYVFYVIALVLAATGFFFCKTDDFYSMYGLLFGYVFADYFEERFVNFKETKHFGKCLLRLLGVAVIFGVLDVVLKLPFSETFLKSGSFLAHLVRFARYAIITFVAVGVYPLAFDKFKKNK